MLIYIVAVTTKKTKLKKQTMKNLVKNKLRLQKLQAVLGEFKNLKRDLQPALKSRAINC